MELQSIAGGLAASSVTTGINVGVLKAVQNLDQAQANLLFSSIGLGGAVDSYA